MRQGPHLHVLFDVTRLLARSGFATPTGIDRVDRAYLEALHDSPQVELHLVRLDALGPHLLAPREAERVLHLLARSHERPSSTADQISFETLQRWLQSPPGTRAPRQVAATTAPVESGAPAQRLRRLIDRPLADLRLRELLGRQGHASCLYLNTSHGQSYRTALARWLRRTRIASAFFVHDLLPIEFPQFNRAAEPARHAARMRTASECARHVIVNSEVTRDVLRGYLEKLGRHVPPITVLPLGVGPEFRPDADRPVLACPVPYFVVLGTIEPRKNHALLLRVWRQLVDAHGTEAPRLVILGRRGWNNEALFQELDGGARLGSHVVEWPGLGDAAVIELVRSARALLAPSFAEGYHLPVAEALALGTPVLVSDIAAHREIGADHAVYVDPAADAAWQNLICEYADRHALRRGEQAKQIQAYRPPRWPDHLSRALAILNAAAREV